MTKTLEAEISQEEIEEMFQQIIDAPEVSCEAYHRHTSATTGEIRKMPSPCTETVTHRYVNSKFGLSINVCDAFAIDYVRFATQETRNYSRIIKI